MSAFNFEDKVTWNELAPSAQELFKTLQSQITNESNARIAADNQFRSDLNTLKTDLTNLINKKVTLLETRINNLFDSQGRLVFPNGDKFWIG